MEDRHQKKVALDMSSAVINGDYLYGVSHYDAPIMRKLYGLESACKVAKELLV